MFRLPLDPTPYPRHPDSVPLQSGIADGLYVYVRDELGVVHVLPDAPHRHPRVLGRCSPAMYAGDITILVGQVRDLTNLSGTFQFDEPEGLLAVADEIEARGIRVIAGAVRFFPMDGSRPRVLR